jgi:transporter family protein
MFATSWFIWSVLAAFFAALMSVFAKLSLQRIDPDVAQFFRTSIVLASITLLVASRSKLGEMVDWSARTWLFLSLSALATAASWICYFRALDLGDATRVSAVDKLSLAIVAILAASFLGERLNVMNWCGVLLVSLGLVMLTLKS